MKNVIKNVASVKKIRITAYYVHKIQEIYKINVIAIIIHLKYKPITLIQMTI